MKELTKQELQDEFKAMRNTVKTPDELLEFIKQNWDLFCLNAKLINCYKTHKVYPDVFPKLEFMTLTLAWSDVVRNTHSCPFNGVKNWSGVVPKAPHGYPGWTGKIEYQVDSLGRTNYEFGSEAWEGTGINTGTGGYASNYYYYLELYADDWPAMADVASKAKVWKKISSDKRSLVEIEMELAND